MDTTLRSPNLVKACKVYVEMENGVEEALKSEDVTKSVDNKVDLLKDIRCSSGNSSDTSELIEKDTKREIVALGREPSISVSEKEEEIARSPDNLPSARCPDNLPVQSDVLEDRGTGFNFGKRWSYFNGDYFCFCMGVMMGLLHGLRKQSCLFRALNTLKSDPKLGLRAESKAATCSVSGMIWRDGLPFLT